MAELVSRVNLQIRERPVVLQRWAPAMAELGVQLDHVFVWALLPKLPLQYLEVLQELGAFMGTYLSSKYSVEEMMAGATPTVCLRIKASDPLVTSLKMPVDMTENCLWRDQAVKYLDIGLKCSFYGKDGHMHMLCPSILANSGLGQGHGGCRANKSRDSHLGRSSSWLGAAVGSHWCSSTPAHSATSSSQG